MPSYRVAGGQRDCVEKQGDVGRLGSEWFVGGFVGGFGWEFGGEIEGKFNERR